MITITSEEAKERIGQLLDSLDKEPVTITREGRPPALLLSADEAREFIDNRNRRRKAVEAYDEWKAGAQKHLKPAAAELTDEEINRLVHELR